MTYTRWHTRPSQKDLARVVYPKGVGRGPTLAWPGWKQSVIAVEVDTGRLETSRFKKCYANCVLLYFPSTEIKSAFNVYWHGGGASGLSCTELSIWEFPFLRGVCWQRWTSIWYSEKGMPQKDTLDNLRTPVCFRIPSSSFTSVSIFSVWCYSSVLYLNGLNHTAQIFLTWPRVWSCVRHSCNPLESLLSSAVNILVTRV